MDMIKISSYLTNQNPVALFPILDDASVKLALFQPSTVVLTGTKQRKKISITRWTETRKTCLLIS
jgi:hypothetical protein